MNLLEKIGDGKDGIVFSFIHNKKTLVIKFFKTKSANKIKKQVIFQNIAYTYGLSPPIIEYNLDERYIIMPFLKNNLYTTFIEQNYQLTINQQKQLIKLFNDMDNIGIFHGDPNPMNFLINDKGVILIIDYGFSKEVSPYYIKKYSNTPNLKYMCLGLIIHLRKINKNCKLEHLTKFIDNSIIKKS